MYMGHTGWVRALCLSSDGNFLFSGANDNTVRKWAVRVCFRCVGPFILMFFCCYVAFFGCCVILLRCNLCCWIVCCFVVCCEAVCLCSVKYLL